jgi:hypothetical protein
MRQFETTNFAFCVKGAGLPLHIIIESKPLIIILFGVLIQIWFSWAACIAKLWVCSQQPIIESRFASAPVTYVSAPAK